jgi:hypothetical protein
LGRVARKKKGMVDPYGRFEVAKGAKCDKNQNEKYFSDELVLSVL